ncbi:PCRF domain-containing protein, partial [bacterium LRH843]|nr:PCRF domain-containing protein [bacterium LRH843]
QDLITEAESALGSLRDVAAKQQLQSMLSGEADGNDCFLEVHAGAGGTESQDWAEMLQRMYLRWADKRGFKTEMLEE